MHTKLARHSTAGVVMTLLLTGTSVVGAQAQQLKPLPAAGPCTYSVNYFCGRSTGSNHRAYRSATTKANYARDTDRLGIWKDVGKSDQWVSGVDDTVYITWGRIYDRIYCDEGDQSPAGIAVGCNYTN